jgi:hypothetical protein
MHGQAVSTADLVPGSGKKDIESFDTSPYFLYANNGTICIVRTIHLTFVRVNGQDKHIQQKERRGPILS